MYHVRIGEDTPLSEFGFLSGRKRRRRAAPAATAPALIAPVSAEAIPTETTPGAPEAAVPGRAPAVGPSPSRGPSSSGSSSPGGSYSAADEADSPDDTGAPEAAPAAASEAPQSAVPASRLPAGPSIPGTKAAKLTEDEKAAQAASGGKGASEGFPTILVVGGVAAVGVLVYYFYFRKR